MRAKTIYIAGVPASGKTTLMRRIRKELFGDYTEVRHGSCRAIVSEDGHYVMLGVFDGSTFEGTDRLSMTVIGDAIPYVSSLRDVVVFAEGDRLANRRFLTETQASLIVLDAAPRVLEMRHRARRDNQPEAFLKRCRTKVGNLAAAYGALTLNNNTSEESECNFQLITRQAKKWISENSTASATNPR